MEKSDDIRIRLSSAHKAELQRAASEAGLSLSAWARIVLLRHVQSGRKPFDVEINGVVVASADSMQAAADLASGAGRPKKGRGK
jgi:antitoxin component of RelBE/YafQ-DinJ toxin-antitoxin module